VSAESNARRLVVDPEPEGLTPFGSFVPLATSDRESCSSCFGTGMEVVVGKGARRCRCRTHDAQTKLLEAARIPRRYSECSLSNYHPESNNGSQLRAFNLAYRLVREYPAIDRGLLLTGPCGIGKLHPRNYPCRTESCTTRDHQGY
jgi:hypothetical protein